MNQNFVQHIDEFEELAAPFKDLWRSIVLRAGWFECEGEPRPLVISIKFSGDKPPIKKPAVLPAVGPFKVAWEAVGIDRFDQILKSLREGLVEVEGKKLSLSLRENGKWTEFSSGFVNLERPGVFEWRGREFAEVRYSTTQSVRDDVYNPVRDRRLEELWRSLKTPYWDKNDVLREFFDVERGNQQDEIYFVLSAQIPLRITAETQIKDGRLHLGIEAAAGAKPEKVSVGAIVSTYRPTTKRLTLRLKSPWKKAKGKAVLHQTFDLGADVARAMLLLRYSGKTVERRELLPVSGTTANLGLEAHQALDRSAEFYLAALAGRGNDRGKDFERAVAWLMSFCGFTVIPYSQVKRFEQTAPDILAASKRDNLVLGIECTVSSPNTEGKLAKLRDRCRELRRSLPSRMKILPIVATALEDAQIPATDRSSAAQDEIMILSFERLSELHALAAAGQPVAKSVAYLKKLRSAHNNGLFEAPNEF